MVTCLLKQGVHGNVDCGLLMMHNVPENDAKDFHGTQISQTVDTLSS